jgi:hypothetical protein
MASNKMGRATGDGAALKNVLLDGSNTSENITSSLRAQYLFEVFALPADTAATIAELAFGAVA